LVRRGGLGHIQPVRIGRARAIGGVQVRVMNEQSARQSIDRRRIGFRRELIVKRRIQRIGVGSEVVIEGNVLVENHDQVLNRSGRRGSVGDYFLFCFRFGGRGESGSNGRSQGNGHRE